MRFLFCFVLVLGPLFAQNAGPDIYDSSSDVTERPIVPLGYRTYVFSEDYTSWMITRTAENVKEITYSAVQCSFVYQYDAADQDYLTGDPSTPPCIALSPSAAMDLGPIKAGLMEFYSIPDVTHLIPVYSPPLDPGPPPPSLGVARPHTATVQPTVPGDPRIILFDGLGLNMDEVDLNTFATVAQVPVNINLAIDVSTFGVRPTTTGDAHEVWIASPGTTGITIADFGSGKIAAGIPTPALTINDYPLSVVFANNGATALEAVAYSKPDAAGNNGAILAFDAVGRTLTSTLPLKNAPQELLIAPDGLTAYSLGYPGTITYYDVLSGTADLTAPFPSIVPGLVFLHPDGTRLFCVGCVYPLSAFDLTTRQFTYFPLALAMYGSPVSANMSQDGSVIAITDTLNNVYMVDTRYGNLLTTYPNTSSSMVFPGAPVN